MKVQSIWWCCQGYAISYHIQALFASISSSSSSHKSSSSSSSVTNINYMQMIHFWNYFWISLHLFLVGRFQYWIRFGQVPHDEELCLGIWTTIAQSGGSSQTRSTVGFPFPAPKDPMHVPLYYTCPIIPPKIISSIYPLLKDLIGHLTSWSKANTKTTWTVSPPTWTWCPNKQRPCMTVSLILQLADRTVSLTIQRLYRSVSLDSLPLILSLPYRTVNLLFRF